MVKALAGKKMYYIFEKKDVKPNEALAEVALALHESTKKFEIFDAKEIREGAFEIGTKGKHYAVTRRAKNDTV